MSEHPGFRVVKETPYGPIIERNPDPQPEDEIGEKIGPADEPESPSRREFLKRAAGGVTAVASGAYIAKSLMGGRSDQSYETNEVLLPKPEIVAAASEAWPTFANEIAGYKAMAELHKDEVIFVDKFNRPVGHPVRFNNFTGSKRLEDGKEVKYLYTPGRLNEIGIPEGGISKEWLDFVQTKVQREHPKQIIVGRRHVVGDFNKALDTAEEPGLVSGIAKGEIVKYSDIINHFAEKPVVGAEDLTRKDYVQKEMVFERWNEDKKTGVPPLVVAELRRNVPGLCAQESKFNNGLTSRSGAKGIFQFMPTTWAEYGGQPEDYSSLKKQVEIAGRFLSDLYNQVRAHIGKPALEMLRARYSSEEDFERDLLVPLMINSYNAGAARVGEAARLYCQKTPVEKIPKGKELFLAIANFAEASEEGNFLKAYNKEAREYVPRIYAQAEVLGKVG